MIFSLNELYQAGGVSKQAVTQYAARQEVFDTNIEQLVIEADDLRKGQPGCGVEKMYDMLAPDFIGRDRFVEIMMQLGYRLKKAKNYKRTTIASKMYFPNLIQGLKVNAPQQVWQSDITYLPIGSKHYYAVFIIDVYTKKIVGYKVSDNMRAKANVDALKMAIKENGAPRYHHSDRGSQYTYKEYIAILKDAGCKISMATSAQDNAYAERINRTIKEEYLAYWNAQNFSQLKRQVKKAVTNYNNDRYHNNLPKMAPVCFEKYWASLQEQLRPEFEIYDSSGITDQVYNIPTTHKPNNKSLAGH